MHGYVQRIKEKELHNALSRSPAVAILGPRQSGKSTTAKMLLKDIPSVYLDLQDRVDRNKLSEPELFFVRTSNGAEIDLILERAGQMHLFECKLSKAPKPSRGFYELIDSIKPESAWVIAPVDEPYEIKKGIYVCPPAGLEI